MESSLPSIEHSGKNTYFRDVRVSIERIKDMVPVKGDSTSIRQCSHMPSEARRLAWYTSNLTEDQKRLIKLGNGIEEWTRILLKRVREVLIYDYQVYSLGPDSR